MKTENEIYCFKKLDLTDALSSIELDSIECKRDLRIKLNADVKNVEIGFERFVSLRITDESKLLQYWNNLQYEIESLEISIVKNSSYLKELSELSINFLTGQEESTYTHYGIFLEDDCIEIISDVQPTVVYS